MTIAATTRPTEPRYQHVVQFVREHPWAILPATLDTIVEIVRMRAAGARFSEDEIRERIGAAGPERISRTVGRVQVIPIFGVIAHRVNVMTQISGGTSTEQLAAMFEAALIDPGVTAICLDIDSPGGSVMGMQELADRIFHARGRKPIVAVANATAASAACWLGSQCDEFIVTPSGQVGSIGAMAVHEDLSAAEAKAGVKTTYITSSPFKAEGAPTIPLSDAAVKALQSRVDQYGGVFRDHVARGRGVSASVVERTFGQGRMLSAAEALQVGLVDRIETLEATVARLNQGPAAVTRGARAISPEDSMKVVALPMPNADESQSDYLTRAMGGDEATREACVTQWTSAQALFASLAARAGAPQVRDGEIVVTPAQLAELRAQAAKGQQVTSLEERIRLAESEKAELSESTRQDRITFKVRSLKIPAFRPFARVFLQLATVAEGTFVLTDPKKPVGAEVAVDAWLAEMNRHADTIFATLSTSRPATDAEEPDAAGDRVEYRVRKYLADKKLDPVKDYQAAMRTVLDADPELKEAYVRS